MMWVRRSLVLNLLPAAALVLFLTAPLRADDVEAQKITPRSSAKAAQHISESGAGRKPSAGGAGWGTTLGSLVAVVGLILLTAKVLRKHSPAAQALLPAEVFRVLGRRSLDYRHTIHLVRLGSRLLVLGVSPEGVRTLAEITDPVEIDSLAGLCQQSEQRTLGAGFQRMLQRFGGEEPAAESDPAALRLKARLHSGEAQHPLGAESSAVLEEAG